MVVIKAILISTLVTESIINSISDIRDNKIYNKNIRWGVIVSIICNSIYYSYNLLMLKEYIICLLFACFFSLVLYWLSIWAGGDAKLYILLTSLMPIDLINHQAPIPVVVIIIFIFSIAFVYLAFESILLYFKDATRFNKQKGRISFINIYKSMAFVISCQRIIYAVFYIVYDEYYLLFLFSNIFWVLVYNKLPIKDRLWFVILCGIVSGYSVINYFSKYNSSLEIISILIVLSIIIFRSFSERYCYEEISTSDVKEGMVLSLGTVMMFSASKIRGLPFSTTEDIASRITKEQAESIKIWGETKKGSKTIVVLRKVPFAIFISLGFIIYLVLGMYIW